MESVDSQEIYLDIETDWQQQITVIGFRSPTTGLVQLVGEEATAERLLYLLPRGGRLYTYNGHCFDLPCIRKQLGVDLRSCFDSWDLRWICQRVGLRGGQKIIEQVIGRRRTTEGIDGMQAIILWARYQRGDPEALHTLLRYNAEDVDGLALIRRYLADHGLIAAR